MIRWMGAALLTIGCAGFGYCLAAAHRQEMRLLRRLIHGLQEMEWELKYRLTQLPELCRIGGDAAGGSLKPIFQELARRLDRQETEDIAACLNGILINSQLPRSVRRSLKQLGRTLGRYDLEGQLQGMEQVRRQCRKELQALEEGGSQRLRTYQTLALCSGVALAIILI